MTPVETAEIVKMSERIENAVADAMRRADAMLARVATSNERDRPSSAEPGNAVKAPVRRVHTF